MRSNTAIQRLGIILAVIGTLNPFATLLPARGEVITVTGIFQKLTVTGIYDFSVPSLVEYAVLLVLIVFCFLEKPIFILPLSVIQTVLLSINWVRSSFYIVNTDYYFCIFAIVKVIGSLAILITAIIGFVEMVRYKETPSKDDFSITHTADKLAELSICLFGIFIFLPAWNKHLWINFSVSFVPHTTHLDCSWVLGIFLATFLLGFVTLIINNIRWRIILIGIVLAELHAYCALLIVLISQNTGSLDYGFIVMVGTIITCIMSIVLYVSYTVNPKTGGCSLS